MTNKANFKSKKVWIRIGMMALAVVLHRFVQWGINTIALLQAVMVLFKGQPHPLVKQIGGQLTQYSLGIMQFLTYNSNQEPYPFAGKFPIDLKKK